MSSRTDDLPEVELKQPLSLWEKTKIGVSSFVKSSLDYIPRGIFLSAIFTGAMMLIGNMTGLGFLQDTANLTLAGFLTRVVTTVGIITGVVGAIGAYQGIKAHTEFREKEIELQERALMRERNRMRAREQRQELTGSMEEIKLPSGLPTTSRKNIVNPTVR